MARAPLDVAVKVSPSPASDVPLDTVALVLLHCEGHFRVLERSVRDFQHLELQLQLESEDRSPAALPSVLPAIDAYCGTNPSFYPAQQLGVRLAVALETFVRQLLTRSELLATSLALKTFLHGSLLTSHGSAGGRYRDAVEDAMNDIEEVIQWTEERVAAGCSVEHQVSVDEQQLVLWKFTSIGSGLVFSAQFSIGEGKESGDVDPYSVSSEVEKERQQDHAEVVHYRTSCDFSDSVEDAEVLYGHIVTEKNGVVTMQWENEDMSSVISKSLRFQVNVVPLTAAGKVLEVADTLNAADSTEWLHEYVSSSVVTTLEDVPSWGSAEGDEDGFGEDSVYDDDAGEGPEKDSQIQSAVLEERTHELEAQVTRLEESLAATKMELKSALDRVLIAEEIYKANLETITQLEVAPKATTRIATKREESAAAPPVATLDDTGPQPEGAPSSELERVQRLCAGFQEQCLWRSVENMELEAQLAASQVEASSWRERHSEQAAQLETLAQQNRTLRTHKKMLVQEVKRLQPYSQVNLAALVQEAQEARMVQRSLQAKLDSHEQLAGEPAAADFVLVEASEEQPEP